MIVGEGLVGVLIAGIVAFPADSRCRWSATTSPRARHSGSVAWRSSLAVLLLYRWIEGLARRAIA